ncbi:hypothetical protein BC936DRAFT_149341 [Jimgerdemannia flammicorona]|uniref:Uncharacterized protein n=1 Tax=Jimgerdemannia flammicorona TaxID=994334 RepID=A0A433D127_9FUNG|nr:hypothetical protein BC936DRAFT_149341 [Jimgerdemannia flammicorona]
MHCYTDCQIIHPRQGGGGWISITFDLSGRGVYPGGPLRLLVGVSAADAKIFSFRTVMEEQ